MSLAFFSSPRVLRFLALGVRWSVRLLLVFWCIVLLGIAILHWVVVPRLPHWQPEIQALLQKHIHGRLQIAEIEPISNGLIPAVRITGVRIEDAEGQEALHIPDITAAVSLRSLWRKGLEQLVLESPRLQVVHEAQSWVIAGQAIKPSSNQDNQAMAQVIDWFLSQPELLIRNGQVEVIDKTSDAPVLHINAVNALLRNRHQTNEMKLSFAPSIDGLAPFEFQAKLRRPLISFGDSLWPSWSGQSWLQWASADAAALQPYFQLLPESMQVVSQLSGRVGLRAWAQWSNGVPNDMTLDLALADAHASLQGAAQPLDLPQFSTRIEAQQVKQGWRVSSQDLKFATGSGLQWQQGDWRLQYDKADDGEQEQVSVGVTHADLAALAQLLKFLPWNSIYSSPVANSTNHLQVDSFEKQDAAAAVRQANEISEAGIAQQLARWQPSGEVENLNLSIRGPLRNWSQIQMYDFDATLHNVSLGMHNESEGGVAQPATKFGIFGLSGTIGLNQSQGKARIQIENGGLRLPSEFEQTIVLDRAKANASWTVSDQGQIALTVENAEAANADAQGTAKLHWRTYTDEEMAQYQDNALWAGKKWPGVLDLEALLTRANGAQTYKYLPLSIPAEAREYVKEAILKANSNNVSIAVKGDLHRFPFAKSSKEVQPPTHVQHQSSVPVPAQELFRITASVTDGHYRYLPHYLLPDAHEVWPDLTDLQAELVFEGNSMNVTVNQGHVGGDAHIQIQPGSQAKIADFHDTIIEVKAQAQGLLQRQLDVLATTPVAGYTAHVLDDVKATGNASFSLDLNIPLHQGHDSYRVQGAVNLLGNHLRWWPQVPTLDDVRGQVFFTQDGFQFDNIKAKALGGNTVISAKMQEMQQGQPVRVEITAAGQLSAQGLQDYVPDVAAKQLTAHLSGNTDYRAVIHTVGEQVFLQIESDLKGLGSSLPAPLNKPALATMPLRIHSFAQGEQEEMRIRLGHQIDAKYWLTPAHKGVARRSTGQIWVGDFSEDEKNVAPVNANLSSDKANTVWAFVQLPQLDAKAWYDIFSPAIEASASTHPAQKQASAPANMPYWPTASRWSLQKLQWDTRTMHDVRVQLRHESPNASPVNAAIRSQELTGEVDYFPAGIEQAQDNAAGLIKARLSYLELPNEIPTAPPADSGKVGSSSGNASESAASPDSIRNLPALDLDIERLLLAQRDWGHLKLQAVNLGTVAAETEWRINLLSIDVPEAQLEAIGNWKLPRKGHPLALLSASKRTALDFKLEIKDAGRLLARLGMPDILRAGRGKLEGNLSWIGPPIKLDYPSLAGQFKLRIENGQLLKASAGVGRLLGVLSLQALPRRITLDFRDIFSEGFAFDFVQGDFHVADGEIETNNLQMKGVNAAVVIEGSADIVHETQNIRALIVPEINTMTAALVATAINPAVGAGAFLAQLFLGKPISKATTREFHVHGSWTDPIVDRIYSSQSE